MRWFATIRSATPTLIERVRGVDLRRLVQGSAARRVLLLLALCAALGWVVGGLMRESKAEKAYSRSALDAITSGVKSESHSQRVGSGTIVLTSRGNGGELLAAENVPTSIRKAREQGAKARERAVQETILNEQLGRYAKDHGWGQGGPYFPLGGDLLRVTPRERPIRTASTYEMAPAFGAMPLSVANPLTSSLFGPGDPGTPPHQAFLETFQNPLVPVIPEPASWALFILGFWAVALRLRHLRSLAAAGRRI